MKGEDSGHVAFFGSNNIKGDMKCIEGEEISKYVTLKRVRILECYLPY
jgi:hypothetical protein